MRRSSSACRGGAPRRLCSGRGALRRDPGLIAAHSWRAAIFMVGVDYRAARKECRALERRWTQPDAAERHFRDALALGLRDDFLLAAYADFLLERGRPKEVVELLTKWGQSDNLLLRLALAAKRLGLADAQKHAQALGERFAAAALRGERLHLAEEARFRLELKGDAKGALAAAAENWKSQREPRDAALWMVERVFDLQLGLI